MKSETTDDSPVGPPMVGVIIAAMATWMMLKGEYVMTAVLTSLLVALTIGYYAIMTVE